MARTIDILVAVPQQDAGRYFKNMRQHDEFRVRIVSELDDLMGDLANKDHQTDILVLSQDIPGATELINDLRGGYPRLLIVLVDEEADFAIPGQADDISTDPFEDDDLARRIQRLMSDRQLETLRADSLPAVRTFAKKLRDAVGETGKLQAAAAACSEMNYDYVACYKQDRENPIALSLKAHEGTRPIRSVAPKAATTDDLMGWVAQTGQSRVAAPEDTPNHPLVAKGRLGAVACVPINISGVRYGVLVACREIPGSITQENVLMLELVSSQLAAALLKEGVR
ncbi:MAG: GAF domain-containing protein [Chloroflexota bacterium]